MPRVIPVNKRILLAAGALVAIAAAVIGYGYLSGGPSSIVAITSNLTNATVGAVASMLHSDTIFHKGDVITLGQYYEQDANFTVRPGSTNASVSGSYSLAKGGYVEVGIIGPSAWNGTNFTVCGQEGSYYCSFARNATIYAPLQPGTYTMVFVNTGSYNQTDNVTDTILVTNDIKVSYYS